MSAPQVELVKCQDGHFSYSSGTSHSSSTLLPPVSGHLVGTDNYASRLISKLPQWSRFSDSKLSSSLPDCRELRLPGLTEQTQIMTSQRPPPTRAAATTQCVEDPQMKHWSSELPAYTRRSWRQSMDSVSQPVPASSEDGNYLTKTNYHDTIVPTTLQKSSSVGGFLIDKSMTSMTARRASLSMDNLRDQQLMVIVILSSSLLHLLRHITIIHECTLYLYVFHIHVTEKPSKNLVNLCNFV